MDYPRTDNRPFAHSSSPRLTRRSLLRAVALGASIVGGGALLAACGGSPTATTAPAGTATATRAAVPSSGASAQASAAASAPASAAATPADGAATPVVGAVTPTSAPTRPAATPGTPVASGKLPSPGPNVPDAYVTPPASFRSVSAVPGRGSKISIVKASQQPPPVARESNAWWLELEKRIGATLDITLVPLPQYTEKATLLIASGQIPDILLISPLSVPDQYRAVQDGAFADLTSALGAEALKAYPNLAQYPASSWKNSQVRGKAFGVPRLGLAIGPALLYRQDWAEKLGIAQPRNADDVLRLVTAMSKNDPDGNGKPDTFGLGSQGADWSMSFIQGMHRVPNGWRKNVDGTLTNAIETDEYRQAIAFARRAFEAGAYHPDAVTFNRTQATNALIAGQIGGYADQLIQLNGDIRTRFEAK